MKICSLRNALIALCACALPATVGATDADPVLLYSFNVQSETVDSWSLGIVTGLIGEAYRKSHESFLAAMQSTDQAETESRLMPFACIDTTEPQKCNRVVRAPNGFTDEHLIPLLSAQAARSARVVYITVIFDGRFFQVPTRMYEARLSDAGAIVRSEEIRVTYIRTYSRSEHLEDIQTKRNETPFAGKVGSKDARMHFWLGGTRPKLTEALDESFDHLAKLWATTRSPEATGVFAGDYSRIDSLPRVKDLASREPGKCKTLHGDLLVAREVGQLLWLVGPEKKRVQQQFFVEPRCGFDY